MEKLEEKDVTLPAPTIRRMIRASRLEYERLESVDPHGSHRILKEAISEAEDSVCGKDGEFASIPAITAVRLEENAGIIHANLVDDLSRCKKHLLEELGRRGVSNHNTYIDSTRNS